ncbi:MAG: acyltransferase [Tidjanibacter sp.]|nr:acyltransferase [Tidjanibacter sp.]
MKNRYNFLDNVRWVTVLLVLFYHVFYNFNALGVFGAIGGFADHQWQDIFCAMLNPWFMALLFVVAGASSRYALDTRTTKEFRQERTRKLLVPTTLGLVTYGGLLGLLNMHIADAAIPSEVPLLVKWLIAAVSGTGPMWFLQDLFGFSLLLLLVRKMADVEKVEGWLQRLPKWGLGVLMMGFLGVLWMASQSQIDNPSAAQGLLNLYRPAFYFVAFLAGYYIFSSERVHDYLAERAGVLIVAALVCGVGFCSEFYGKDYTSPEVVQGLWCNLFCWSGVLAMLGAFRRWANGTSPLAVYMTRSSFGVYVVHMAVCTGSCLLLRTSGLPVWAIYLLALAMTYAGSFALWEILRRVPVLNYCIFGIKSKRGQ